MENECPKCHQRINGILCDYICKGIDPTWLSINRPDFYAKRPRRYHDGESRDYE